MILRNFFWVWGSLLDSQWSRRPQSLAQGYTEFGSCKFLGQGISLARSNWYEFRNRCGKFSESSPRQISRLAIDEKLVTGRECSLDGTFTAATASSHKLLNLEQINRRLDMVQYAIHIHENSSRSQFPRAASKIPGWVAKTPSGRQRQLEMYRESQRILLEKLKKIGNVRPIIEKRKQDCCGPADPEAAVVATSTM